ncbi:MAG: alpha/beta hydrolase family protein [Nitriliruptoraceae bacterium]
MGTQRLDFPGSTGARLEGVLHTPEGGTRGSILLAHCFTCSKDLHTMTRLARGLADAGYAVLRFDFTGLGDSEGEFGATSISHDVRDVVAAASALIARGYGPCGLLGHSLGGAAALLAAERVRTVRSLVVLGAPATASHVRHLIADHEATIRAQGCATVTIGGRSFPIGVGFLDDLEAHDDLDHVTGLGRPLLVVHAVDDAVVDVSEGERLFAAARQPKGFVPLLGTDHLLMDRAAAGDALRIVTDWFDRTL